MGPKTIKSTWSLKSILDLGGDYDILSDPRVTSRQSKKSHTTLIPKATGGTEKNGLCSVCREIDFATIFSTQPSLFRPPVFELPQPFPDTIDARCPLCRIFAEMLRPEQDIGTVNDRSDKSKNDKWCLRAFPPSDFWGIVDRNSVSLSKQNSVAVICLSGTNHSSPLSAVEQLSCFYRGMILPAVQSLAEVKFGDNYTCIGFPIQSKVDFERARGMLKSCLTKHPACQARKDLFPSRAKVIDCTSLKVIPMIPDMEYITLSYVWGHHSSTKADERLKGIAADGTLPIKPPKTISDAMLVTKRMGYNYLWVDCYCIDQNNPADKMHQIGEMAKIYFSSIATICALGDNDETGLDGISLQRPCQSTFSKKGTIITKSHWGLALAKKHVENSAWSTRGWTYQEAILSNRCLIFTSDGLLMICKSRTICEGILEPDALDHPSERMLRVSDVMFDTSFYDAKGPALLNQINQYQKRSLTFDGDALDAFKGVLSQTGLLSSWAVPCMTSFGGFYPGNRLFETGFVYGLTWKVQGSSHPQDPRLPRAIRPGFPSWSWISMKKTQIAYDYLEHRDESARHTCVLEFQYSFTYFVPEMSGVTDEGKLVRLESLFTQQKSTNPVLEKPNCLHIRTIKAHRRLKNENTTSDATPGLPVVITKIQDPKLKTSLNGTGLLFLDGRDASSLTQAADQTTNTSRVRDKGIALLLLIYSPVLDSTTRWLVVDDNKDGTYSRIGLMEFDSLSDAKADDRLRKYAPPIDALAGYRIM